MSARTHGKICNATSLGYPRNNFDHVSHVTGDGASAAELTVAAGTGFIRHDHGRGRVLRLERSAVFENESPPAGTILDPAEGFAVLGPVKGRLLTVRQSPDCIR